MGLEAYRMLLQLNDNITKDNIVKLLESLGANTVSRNKYGEIALEIEFEEGILEISLENPYEKRMILNELALKNEFLKQKSIDSYIDRTIIYLRFAKPNSIDLVDRIMEFCKRLDNKYPIKTVFDLQKKEKINIDRYADFKERVLIAKDEFDKYHPNIKYPIRCKEVFKVLSEMNPGMYTKTTK